MSSSVARTVMIANSKNCLLLWSLLKKDFETRQINEVFELGFPSRNISGMTAEQVVAVVAKANQTKIIFLCHSAGPMSIAVGNTRIDLQKGFIENIAHESHFEKDFLFLTCCHGGQLHQVNWSPDRSLNLKLQARLFSIQSPQLSFLTALRILSLVAKTGELAFVRKVEEHVDASSRERASARELRMRMQDDESLRDLRDREKELFA